MVNCLPQPGSLSALLFAVPVLLVRCMRRRAVHWIVIRHQRYLHKLSVRRRRHQSLGNKPSRSCSEPESEPSLPVPLLENSGEETHDGDKAELEVHVSMIHVPVRPMLVLRRSFSCARVPPLPHTHTRKDLDDLELSSRLGVATLSHKKKPPVSLKLSGGSDSGSASGSPKHISCNRPTTGNHPLLANCSSFSCKTSPSENPPNEFAPPLPYVSLDDGKRLKLIPLYQKLMEKSYFHLISRPKAKNLIMSGEDGMFLIRPSTKSGDPLTLVLNLEKHLYNINIRQRPDSLFALGKEKAQEKAFSSLDELVITYTTEPIKLENGKMAFLKHSPSKTSNSYVKHYPPALAKKY